MVGGETLEAAIENAAMGARFAICGSIHHYNVGIGNAYGVKVRSDVYALPHSQSVT